MTLIRGLLSAVLPFPIVLAAVIVSAVPWGLPASTGFVLPIATAMLIYLYSAKAQPGLPAWFVFLAGVLTDMLTAGPLGYWALIFLLAHALGRALPYESGALTRFAVYIATAAITAAVAWGVASLYYVRVIDWRPMVFAAAAAVALFPILLLLSAGGRRAEQRAGERP